MVTEEAMAVGERIVTAGQVFIGPYSAVAFGDYLAGPSHVLPTGGSGAFAGPLSVNDFVKRTGLVSLSQEAAVALSGPTAALARGEGLEGHALAAELRAAPPQKRVGRRREPAATSGGRQQAGGCPTQGGAPTMDIVPSPPAGKRRAR